MGQQLYYGVSLEEKAEAKKKGGCDLEQGRWDQYHRKTKKSSFIEQIRVAIVVMWLIGSFFLTLRFADRWVCDAVCDAINK